MAAATQRLGVSAHNVANAATEGFQRLRVVPNTQGSGGVSVSVSEAPAPGNDLAGDMVDQRVALYAFKANLQVFKTEQDMLGTLLDVQS